MNDKKSGFIEVGKFIGVGILNTSVDIGSYYFLTRLIPFFSLHLVGAKATSYFIATVCSFIVNRYFTFAKKGPVHYSEILRFYVTVPVALLLNAGTLFIFVHLLHGPDLIGAVLAAGVTFTWNYLTSKFWVFKDVT